MKLSTIAGLILIGLVGAFAACGDDDSTTNVDGTGGAVSTTAPSSDETDEPADTTATQTPDGGDNEDYQAYFEDLAARFELSRNDSDAATAQVNAELEAGTTLGEDKAAIDLFLETMVEVFDDSILTMNGFDPPSEAEDAHFTFRDDIVQAREISITLRNDVAGAATSDEAQAILDAFDVQVGALVNDAQAACRDLQDIADEKNIDEDLECRPA